MTKRLSHTHTHTFIGPCIQRFIRYNRQVEKRKNENPALSTNTQIPETHTHTHIRKWMAKNCITYLKLVVSILLFFFEIKSWFLLDYLMCFWFIHLVRFSFSLLLCLMLTLHATFFIWPIVCKTNYEYILKAKEKIFNYPSE